MNAGEVMARDVTTVRLETSVSEVVRLLLATEHEGVAVIDDSRKLLGVVTETDVVAKHARPHVPTYLGFLGYVFPFETHSNDEEVRRVLAVTAGDLMSTDIPTVEPDVDIDDVATLMVEEHVNPVPVVQDGVLLGMIGHADIMRLLLREEESDPTTAATT